MVSSIKIIQVLKKNGWKLKSVRGDHYQFVNPDEPEKGKVTVTHPKKDVIIGNVKSIEKQTGLKFK